MNSSERAKMVYQQALYPDSPIHSRQQVASRFQNPHRNSYLARPPHMEEFYSDESSSCDSDCDCCDDEPFYDDHYHDNPSHNLQRYQQDKQRFYGNGHQHRAQQQRVNVNQLGQSSRQGMAGVNQLGPGNHSRHSLHRSNHRNEVYLPQQPNVVQRVHQPHRKSRDQRRYSHHENIQRLPMPQGLQNEPFRQNISKQSQQNMFTHPVQHGQMLNHFANVQYQNQALAYQSITPQLALEQTNIQNAVSTMMPNHLTTYAGNTRILQTQMQTPLLQTATGFPTPNDNPEKYNTQIQRIPANHLQPQLRSSNPYSLNSTTSPQLIAANAHMQHTNTTPTQFAPGMSSQMPQQRMSSQIPARINVLPSQFAGNPGLQNYQMSSTAIATQQMQGSQNGMHPHIRGVKNTSQQRMNNPYNQQSTVIHTQVKPSELGPVQSGLHIDQGNNALPSNTFQDENTQSAMMLYMMNKNQQTNQTNMQTQLPQNVVLPTNFNTTQNQIPVLNGSQPVERDTNARYSQVNKTTKKLVTFDIQEEKTREVSNEKFAKTETHKEQNYVETIPSNEIQYKDKLYHDEKSKTANNSVYNESSDVNSIYKDPTALLNPSKIQNNKQNKTKPVKTKEKKKRKQNAVFIQQDPNIVNESDSIYEDPQVIIQAISEDKSKKSPKQFDLDKVVHVNEESNDFYQSLGKPPKILPLSEPIYDHLSSMLTLSMPINQAATSSTIQTKQSKTEKHLENAQILDTYMQLCKQNAKQQPEKQGSSKSEEDLLHEFIEMNFLNQTGFTEPEQTKNLQDVDFFRNPENIDNPYEFVQLQEEQATTFNDEDNTNSDIFNFDAISASNNNLQKSNINIQTKSSESKSDDSSSEEEFSETSSDESSSYISESDVTSSEDSIESKVVVKNHFKMDRELWRSCVRWLINTGVISPQHKMAQPGGVVFDLAQTLRDGVVLYNLLNIIRPGAVDSNSINLRPQMLQFLCVQNLWAVKNSLHIVFKISDEDLFLPSDLYNMTNVAKVLRTLSILSQLPVAASKFRPFLDMGGAHRNSTYRTDEEEDIYKNLSDMASEKNLQDEEEDLYDCVPEEKEEGIYGSLIAAKPAPSAPKDKRSYCISEIYETEKNYVQHLHMMQEKFMYPFKRYNMSDKDIKAIFMNLEQLNPVHQRVLREIETYKQDGSKMSRAFLDNKDGFLLYGTYCSGLADAQEHLANLMKDDKIQHIVEDCQEHASPSKFKLRELLMVPMQRVLKYHLLVKELNKHTPAKHEDKQDLIKALDSMQEISQYVNEVKRDSEMLVTINQVENCLVDYMSGVPLQTYGRLLKDGELKIRMANDKNVKPRNTFLFDQALFMTKEKGGTYILKDLLRLDEYKLDEVSVGSTRGGKWSFNWTLTAVTGTNSFILSAKAKTDKIKWIEKLKSAFDNIQPQALRGRSHSFKMHSFDKPTYCDACHKLLLGSFYQGYMCEKTETKCHKTCLVTALKLIESNESLQSMKVSDYPPQPVPGRRPISNDSHRKPQPPASTMIDSTPYKAHRKYSGHPQPPFGGSMITFDIGEQIEVTDRSSSDWWQGYSLTHIERSGYFPASHVSPGTNRDTRERPDNYITTRVPPRDHSYPSNLATVSHSRPPTHLIPIEENIWYAGQVDRDGAARILAGRPSGSFLVRTRDDNMAISLLYQNDIKHIRIVKSSENLFYVAECKHFRSVQELVEFYQENTMSTSFLGLETTLKYPYRDPTLFPSEQAQGPPPGMDRPRSRMSVPQIGSPPPLEPRNERQRNSHSISHSNGMIHSPNGPNFDVMGKAKVLFDFDPRSPQELGLKAGQYVNIISKAGDAHGWWKGEYMGNTGYFPATFIEEL